MKRLLDHIGECLGEPIISNLKQKKLKKTIFNMLGSLQMRDYTMEEWMLTLNYLWDEAQTFHDYEELSQWFDKKKTYYI